MLMNTNYFRAVLVLFTLLIFTSSYAQSDRATQVVIVYESASGHTKALAELILKGVLSVKGIKAKALSVEDAKVADVLSADAIILGSPVYNANPAPKMLEFISRWPFAQNTENKLQNKLGAVFVTAGGYSAGEEDTKWSLLRAMMIFRMVIVGGDNWRSATGLTGFDNEFVTKTKILTANEDLSNRAFVFGVRVASMAQRFVA